MKIITLSKIFIINRLIIFIIILLLITTCFSTILPANVSKEYHSKVIENVLEFTYTFSSLEPIQTNEGTILQIDGLDIYTPSAGAPIVPMKTVKFLIPQGQTLERIDVDSGPELLIPMTYDIAPVQQVIPLSYTGPIELTERDLEIYESLKPYPGRFYDVVSLQHCRGFTILILNLFPLQYIPKTKEMYYYTEMDLAITCNSEYINSASISSCRMFPCDTKSIQNMDDIQNLEVLSTYNRNVQHPESNRDMKNPINPDDTISYAIITNEELRDSNADYTFQDLVQSKINKGMTAAIVTVEEIEACPDYWWDGAFGDGNFSYNDTQCQIRNFIKDAYANWDTEYILLGGDGDGADVGGESGDSIIPVRIIDYGESEPLASDVYYTCLDGSYDSNGNGVFGEFGDGADIDPQKQQVDLLAEVYIGRVPVDSTEELSNYIQKTLTYENCEIDESLRNAIMVGEYLGFWYNEFGAYCKEKIRHGSSDFGYTTAGIPDIYNVSTLYDLDWDYPGWPKSEILSVINDGVHFINHLGHGNNFKVMKLYEPVKPLEDISFVECHDVIENMTNNQYFFGYSQACFSGSFDNKCCQDWGGGYLKYDCIMEYLIGAPHGAFAFIANTRYGLGTMGSTNAPSQNYDREFFDALFGENIKNLGIANQDSKDDNIGKISYYGMRYCFYELTLFGDPELSLKDPPLREHDLAVTTIDAPNYFWINTSDIINVTICNHGLEDETNINVNAYVDEVLVYTTTISSLQSQDCITLNFSWMHDTIGRYELKVEVIPVSDENYFENNIKTTFIVVTSQEPVQAFVLDGFVSDFHPSKYSKIEIDWYLFGLTPVEVDLNTLNHDFITYAELMESEADVLIVDACLVNDGINWEFTLEEIDAITQYILDGHGLIACFDTFGANNSLLLPLLGLNIDAVGHELNGSHELIIFNESHSLFNNIPNPCFLSMSNVLPFDEVWNENELSTGQYIAQTPEGKGAIVWNGDNRIYYSMNLWYTDYFYNNQLIYNAIVTAAADVDLYVHINESYAGVVGEPIQFHGFASGGIPPYSYYWDFGDSNNSEEQHPNHVYSCSGIFNITLTVTDDIGNESSASSIVTITEPEPLVVDAHGPYSQLVGQPIQFQGSASGGVPPYQQWYWDFGEGNTSDEQNPLYLYHHIGEYFVNLTVTDYVNNTSYNSTTAVTTMEVIPDVPDLGKANEPLTFYSQVYGGFPNLTYHWDFGDGNTSCLENPVYTYHSGGKFTVTLTVYDRYNNSANGSDNITITPMIVYVDDDFNESTPGWGWACFDSISLAAFYAPINATIMVFEGIYTDSDINIDKSLHLFGQNPANTIIDGRYFFIQNCDSVIINGFTVQNINTAIRGNYVCNSSFVNNIITNCVYGIRLYYESFNNTISRNSFIDLDWNGVTCTSVGHSNEIFNNSFINMWAGVKIGNDAHKNSIFSNTCINTSRGILVDGNGHNNSIHHNDCISNVNGIRVEASSRDNNLFENTISNSTSYGILVEDYSIENCIFKNTISNSNSGICLLGNIENTTIVWNTISDNKDHGILIQDDACDNRIENNNLSKNGIGICVSDHPWNNKIIGNTITGSISYGMYIHNTWSENLLYHNNFIINTQNAYDDSTNIWNNDTILEGNYWDDFENNSGYPYNYSIPGGNNIDLYPLAEPYQPLLGDINDDGKVNIDDLFLVLSAWGQTGSPGWIPEDLNYDGIINIDDLFIVLGNWT